MRGTIYTFLLDGRCVRAVVDYPQAHTAEEFKAWAFKAPLYTEPRDSAQLDRIEFGPIGPAWSSLKGT